MAKVVNYHELSSVGFAPHAGRWGALDKFLKATIRFWRR
jgi:hypothetical protein